MTPEVNKFAAQVAKGHVARLAERGAKLGPIQTEEDLFARGYIGEDGQATDEGSQFLALQDAGIFDAKGQLSLKGEAFIMPTEDLETEDKLPHYIMARTEGLLDPPETSFGDAAGAVGEMLWDAGAGLLKEIDASFFPSEKKSAESQIRLRSAAVESVKGSAMLGAGIAETLATGIKINGKQVIPGMLDQQEDQLAYFAAQQKVARAKREIQDFSEATATAAIVGSMDVVNELESEAAKRIQQIGPDAAAAAVKEGAGIGTILTPDSMLTAGTGFFVSKAAQGPTLAARLSAKVTAAKTAGTAAEVAANSAQIAGNNVKRLAEIAANSSKQADDLAAIGDIPASIAARTTAEAAGARAQSLTSEAARLQLEAANKAKLAEGLVKKSGGAERALDSLNAVHQAKAIPANVVAAAADKVGDFLIRSDELLQSALENIGFNEATRGTIKGAMVTAGIAFPGAASIGAALASGPLVKNIGNLARMIGKEQLAARGSLPFWRRVSQNAGATPFTRGTARFLDSATLGGKAMAPVRIAGQTAKGVGASIPMDVGFEVLAEGGNISANTINQGVAESLVFAGTGGAMGSLVSAPLRAKQRQQMGDVMNFRAEILDDASRPVFDGMSKGSQRTLATYAATNPSLNIKISSEGPNKYDAKLNTAFVNVKSPGWIRPLVAHEVMHHVIVKGQMKDGIQAWLVGTPDTGGLLRSKDGKLDPTFEAAMSAYNRRLEQEGKIPLSVEDFAEEYFIESAVDDFVGMADSGELSKLAARSPLERLVGDTARILIPKIPLIRDIAVKLGGAYDNSGKMVQGNGLLADGVRELPGAKAMIRQMVRISAGETTIEQGGTRKRGGADEERGPGIPLNLLKNNPALAESNFSVFQFDETGNLKTDKDGVPLFITKEQDIQRQLGGIAVAEYYTEKVKQGNLLPGELSPQPDGTWEGAWIDNKAIDALAKSGVFDQRSIRHLRLMNAAAKKPDGSTFMGVNHPATIKRPGKRAEYGTLSATFREFAVNGIKIGKKGQILVGLMSVNQLMQNVEARANSTRGKKLYNGNQLEIIKDVESVAKLHLQNLPTDDFFREKYGPQGQERKNFINTVLGLMTKEQQNINPMFLEDNVKSGGVFRTYRLDRMSQVTKVQGGITMPVGYEHVKANFFPNGLPETPQENE